MANDGSAWARAQPPPGAASRDPWIFACLLVSVGLHVLLLAVPLGEFADRATGAGSRLDVVIVSKRHPDRRIADPPTETPEAFARHHDQERLARRSAAVSHLLRVPPVLATPTASMQPEISRRSQEVAPELSLPRTGRIRYLLAGDTTDFVEQTWQQDGDKYRIDSVCGTADSLAPAAYCASSSVGVLGLDDLVPRHYTRGSFGSSASMQIDWDWEHLKASIPKGTAMVSPGGQDSLSAVYEMGIRLSAGHVQDIDVLVRDGVIHFQVNLVGVETISIPAGEFLCAHVHLDSTSPSNFDGLESMPSDVWYAIESHYLPIRLRGQSAEGKLYELSAEVLEF